MAWTGRKAVALSITLMLMTVLLIMALTLIALARRQSLTVLDFQRECLAQNAAEAGVTRALQLLKSNPGWRAGFRAEALGGATYTVEFTSSLPFGAQQSYANLDGSGPVTGVRGSLPAGAIWLTSVGRCGPVTRTIDAILSRPGFSGLQAGLIGSGRIHLRGDVSVDGQEDPDSPLIPAGLHSNFRGGGGEPSIHWQSLSADDRADISGEATTSDPRPVDETVVFSGAHTVQNRLSAQPVQSVTRLNIPEIVEAARADAVSPTLLSGSETVLRGGRYYLDSLEHTGDIELQEGAELYVNGDVRLEGSIRGKGSVVVNGSTSLRGDVHISARQGLALLSEGDVHLMGFDARRYLEGIPAARPLVQDIQATLTEMLALMETGNTAVLGNHNQLDRLNHHLNSFATVLEHPERPGNLLGSLREVLAAQPADPRRDFLLRKVDKLNSFFDHGASYDQKKAYVHAFLADPTIAQEQVIESLSDVGLDMLSCGEVSNAELSRALRRAAQIVRANRLNRLTSSHFEGLIYTNGDFQASHEIVIVGALITNGRDGSGNIRLEGGTSLTFMQSLFEGEDRLTLPGTLGIQSWAVR